jgi:hypothetical protein
MNSYYFYFLYMLRYPPGTVGARVLFIYLVCLILFVDQIRSDQTRSDQTRSDQIRPVQYYTNDVTFASYPFHSTRAERKKFLLLFTIILMICNMYLLNLTLPPFIIYYLLFTYYAHHAGNITVSIECIIPLHAIIFSCNIIGLSLIDITDSFAKPFPRPT